MMRALPRLLPSMAPALIPLAAALSACGSDNLTLPDQTEPARIEAVSGSNQAGSTGTMLVEPLVVRVTDSEDRPVVGRKVAFVVVGSDGLVSPDTALTDADGRATGRWVLGSSEGSQRLEARVVGPVALTALFVANASTGRAARVEKVKGDGQSAVAGSALPDSLVVRTLDEAGRPVAGVPVAWAAAGGGTVSAPASVSGSDGTAGVRRTLGPATGEQTTVASVDGASGSPLTFTATAVVGEAGSLSLQVGPPGSAQSGLAFSRQPQLQLVDANGNPVARQGLAVTASISSGPAGATLTGSRTVGTNAGGLAVYADLGISGASGSYTLNFSATDVSGASSGPIAVSAGAGTALRMVTQPSPTAVSGQPFGTQPAVRMVDAIGNPVSKANVAVTVGIAGGAGTLGGTTTVGTDGSGVARFTDLEITGSSGQRTLIFASAGLAGVTSAPIVVRTPVSASRSSISSPGSAPAGQTVAIVVRLRDEAGTPIAGVQVSLSATGSDNTLSPATSTSSATGDASFTFSSTVAETKSFTATAEQVSIGPATLEVLPAAPDASQTTAIVPGGRRFRETEIIVTSRDAFGNRMRTGGATVTVDITDGPHRGFLVHVDDLDDGTYRATYTPLFSGDDDGDEHTDTIEIRLNGTPISGSPFSSEVRR